MRTQATVGNLVGQLESLHLGISMAAETETIPAYARQPSMAIFHQTMDKEWTGNDPWGRNMGQRLQTQGFTVFRIRTEHLRELKTRPLSEYQFRDPLRDTDNEQQVICSINIRDYVVPILDIIMLLQNRIPSRSDLLSWGRDQPIRPPDDQRYLEPPTLGRKPRTFEPLHLLAERH